MAKRLVIEPKTCGECILRTTMARADGMPYPACSHPGNYGNTVPIVAISERCPLPDAEDSPTPANAGEDAT